MCPNNPYREKARLEVQTWIELDRVGGLRDKFWYIDEARAEADGSWVVILGEEQMFYSATRLAQTDGKEPPASDEELRETSFEDLGQRCEAVLDEVKNVIREYLSSTGQGQVRNFRVSVGEATYRILHAERLEAWQRDPRRFLAEYTLIESEMRETTCEENLSPQKEGE